MFHPLPPFLFWHREVAMRVTGLVLCGGESQRMGRPKALLPFGDEVLLQRVVRIMSGTFDRVIVVAGPGQLLPELPSHVAIVHDKIAGQGPLFGLATGLAYLAESHPAEPLADARALDDAVFVAACDLPFLAVEFIRCVVAGLGDKQIAVPCVGGQLHPLAACYRMDVLPFVRELLGRNIRSLKLLIERCATQLLDEGDLPDCRQLRNINTPEEYDKALAAIHETSR